ncbi:hypothetical protein [Streptomyces sp. NBC_00035]|uniref:hypothetical protein n=1 Tax=Streptomyces sp. NBC_00035 TaxID=2903614 RepID=UPI003247993C
MEIAAEEEDAVCEAADSIIEELTDNWELPEAVAITVGVMAYPVILAGRVGRRIITWDLP